MTAQEITSYNIPELNSVGQTNGRPSDKINYSFNFRMGELITDTKLKDSVTLFDNSETAHRLSFNMLSETQSFD